eukprot:363794-Chlamydomonas_euryale.AAC.8
MGQGRMRAAVIPPSECPPQAGHLWQAAATPPSECPPQAGPAPAVYMLRATRPRPTKTRHCIGVLSARFGLSWGPHVRCSNALARAVSNSGSDGSWWTCDEVIQQAVR